MDDRVDRDRFVLGLDQYVATGMKWIHDGVPTGYVKDQDDVQTMADQTNGYWIPHCKAAKARGLNIIASFHVCNLDGKTSGAGELGRRMADRWARIIVPQMKPWIKDWAFCTIAQTTTWTST